MDRRFTKQIPHPSKKGTPTWCLAMLLVWMAFARAAGGGCAPPASPGDLDRNGAVNRQDLALLQRYLAGSLVAGQIPAPANADVDGNGRVDAGDGPSLARRVHRPGGSWYEDNPTYVDPRDDSADWRFSTPEAEGLDAAVLADGGNSLAANPCIFSLLVVRHGKLVYERYYHGMDKSMANNIHSASKSLLQALVGLAVENGCLAGWDTKVSDVLPDVFAGAPPNKKNITVRHLLQMSSGLQWTEDDTEYTIEHTDDWVRSVIGRPQLHAPGSVFEYSTGNTHVASGVLQQATGTATHAFAADNLLGAMNITVEHWGCPDPLGVDSGGCNVYLTPREMAKFGLLYLQHGVWNGRRLIPEETVAQAATAVWAVGPTFHYNTGWWSQTVSGHPMYFAWGYGGQFIYVMPDLDIVLVVTENTSAGHYDEIDAGDLVRRYVIPAVTGP